MEIRLLKDGERKDGLELAWDVFLRYDAADYSRESIDAFGYAIHDPRYVRELKLYALLKTESCGVFSPPGKRETISPCFLLMALIIAAASAEPWWKRPKEIVAPGN